MTIDKSKLWAIVERYDCPEYSEFCDTLCNIIKDDFDGSVLLTIYNHYDKIQKEDKDLIEEQMGSDISFLLFSF
jgi:hypothetical protein